MKLLITGYFGMNNLGDDIMLDVFCKYLIRQRKDIEITVALLNGNRSLLNVPENVKIIDLSKIKHGKTVVFRYFLSKQFDAFFWIGGTCFTENAGDGSYSYMKSFSKRGKKTGYLGVGIGNVKNTVKIQKYTELLNQSTLVTFRDIDSYNQAKIWSENPNIYCCEDLVHLADVTNLSDQIRDRIIVSWRGLKGYYSDGVEKAAINELLLFLKKHFEQAKIEIIVLGSSIDIGSNQYIYDKVSEMLPDAIVQYSYKLNTLEKIKHISKAETAILGRLHGIFLAEKMGINTIAIGYDNKSERFLKSIGRTCDLIYPDQITQSALNRAYNNCPTDKINFVEKKEEAIKNIRLFVEKVVGLSES